MRELEILLENRFVVRERDGDDYYRIKDKLKDLRDFLENKLGYYAVVMPDFIKLEKSPGRAEPWMGIKEFSDRIEYALFSMILMFLEDKEKDEQFVLSQLTDYIKGHWPDKENPIDWTLYGLRRKLVTVMKFCVENYLIIADDGDESGFTMEESTEVLYENTGLSKYFMNRMSEDILNYDNYRAFEDKMWQDFSQDRGVLRRNRVYRRLLMSPCVYSGTEADSDFLYIRNYRQVLESDFEKYLEAKFHLHKNMALMLLPENRYYRDVLPNSRNMSDIMLQMCGILADDQEISLNEHDIKVMPYVHFTALFDKCRLRFRNGWGKTYREMPSAKVLQELEKEMEYFLMIKVHRERDEVEVLPLTAKICGDYPKDYYERAKEAKRDDGGI